MVEQRLTHGPKMPLFFYLPAIVWMGMIEVALDATHDLDGRNDAHRKPDPINLTMNPTSIIRFPNRKKVKK